MTERRKVLGSFMPSEQRLCSKVSPARLQAARWHSGWRAHPCVMPFSSGGCPHRSWGIRGRAAVKLCSSPFVPMGPRRGPVSRAGEITAVVSFPPAPHLPGRGSRASWPSFLSERYGPKQRSGRSAPAVTHSVNIPDRPDVARPTCAARPTAGAWHTAPGADRRPSQSANRLLLDLVRGLVGVKRRRHLRGSWVLG
jgi:hypothetical protein